jgi:hypothetical protein
MTVYLSVAQILRLQAALTKQTGGLTGVRDRAGLESACARPAMTFGGEDLYPDLPAKAAALEHGLLFNRSTRALTLRRARSTCRRRLRIRRPSAREVGSHQSSRERDVRDNKRRPGKSALTSGTN